MIQFKKILFCFFVVFGLTAMKKRSVEAPNQSADYYQNAEDFQHSDAVNSGFKKHNMSINSKVTNRVVTIVSYSKKDAPKNSTY